MTVYLSILLLVACATAGCALSAEFWELSSLPNFRTANGAPLPRAGATATWTGTHIIVWGGNNITGSTSNLLSTGAMYDPALDSWVAKPNLQAGVGAPAARGGHTAVWTGTRLYVLFGTHFQLPAPYNLLNSGGFYDPVTDTWSLPSSLSTGTGAPGPRMQVEAVLTPQGILVFGGWKYHLPSSLWRGCYNGGLYDWIGDVWVPISSLATEVPIPQFNDGIVWTGSRVIVRGGFGGVGPLTASQGALEGGGVFDPLVGTWDLTPVLSSGTMAGPRVYRTPVWTGDGYLEFGGLEDGPNGDIHHNNGYLYDSVTDSYVVRPSLASGLGAPSARSGHVSHWTGTHLFVWGGSGGLVNGNSQPPLTNGGLYSPTTDIWTYAPNLQAGTGAPSTRGGAYTSWTGDRILSWGGRLYNVLYNDGAIYIPPRVAPTLRNLNSTPSPGKPNGDRGASAAFPLQAVFNQSFKHRIVCYGTPEAAIITYADKPWWMNVGWGGPGPLVAHGTGQGNGGTGGAPPGTGAPFHPWFSATGGTADGQWIRGTPGPRDTGLHSFTVHAYNGIFPDAATRTVWIEIAGPSVIASMPTTFASGQAQPLPSPPVIPGPNPPPPGAIEAVALSGQPYSYYPTINAIPAGTQTVAAASWSQPQAWAGGSAPQPAPLTGVGLPAWLAWDGFGLSGIPGEADEYQSITITLTATNTHGSDSQTFTLYVLPTRPVHAALLDVNGDSTIDVTDAQAMVNIILFGSTLDPNSNPPAPLSTTVPHPALPSPATALRGDVTLNGTVDVIDIQALINGIIGR